MSLPVKASKAAFTLKEMAMITLGCDASDVGKRNVLNGNLSKSDNTTVILPPTVPIAAGPGASALSPGSGPGPLASGPGPRAPGPGPRALCLGPRAPGPRLQAPGPG